MIRVRARQSSAAWFALGPAQEHVRARRAAAAFALNGPWMRDRLHVRRAVGRVRIVEVAQKRLQARGRHDGGRLVRKRRHELVPAGLDEEAHAQPLRFDRVGCLGRVLLQRDEIVGAAELGEQHALAVQRQLDLMRGRAGRSSRSGSSGTAAPESHIRRRAGTECCARHAAERAERQAVEVLVLRQILPDRVGVAARRRRAGRRRPPR